MRVLVLSDSHSAGYTVRAALAAQPLAKTVIHLGDGADDAYSLGLDCPNRDIYTVKGNNDYGFDFPENLTLDLGGVRVFCTHGHRERVKYTLDELVAAARRKGAAVALYGHTHVPVTIYDDGLYLFNPGALMSGEYGVLDITPAGIVPVCMRLS